MKEISKRIDPLREYRLKILRIKTFIIDLLEALGEDPVRWSPYFNEIVRLTLMLEDARKRIHATLYEAALTAFFYDLRARGILVININRLIDVAKNELEKRISRGRVIMLLNYIRRADKNATRDEETKHLVVSLIYKLSSDTKLLRRLISRNIDVYEYFNKLRYKTLDIIKSILNSKFKNEFYGRSPNIIVGISIYLADRLISKHYGLRSILSAKIIETHLGISQFTILRQYKRLMEELIHVYYEK